MPDTTTSTKVVRDKGGDDILIQSGGTETVESGAAVNVAGTETVQSGGVLNVASGGALQIAGSALTDTAAEENVLHGAPATASFAAAAGAANVCNVTITVKDANGVTVAAPTELVVWLSDASTGAGLTATTASGTVVAGASGVDFGDLTAKKAKVVQTNASGVYVLAITDTAKTGFYVCARPLGAPSPAAVSAQLITANYG